MEELSSSDSAESVIEQPGRCSDDFATAFCYNQPTVPNSQPLPRSQSNSSIGRMYSHASNQSVSKNITKRQYQSTELLTNTKMNIPNGNSEKPSKHMDCFINDLIQKNDRKEVQRALGIT